VWLDRPADGRVRRRAAALELLRQPTHQPLQAAGKQRPILTWDHGAANRCCFITFLGRRKKPARPTSRNPYNYGPTAPPSLLPHFASPLRAAQRPSTTRGCPRPEKPWTQPSRAWMPSVRGQGPSRRRCAGKKRLSRRAAAKGMAKKGRQVETTEQRMGVRGFAGAVRATSMAPATPPPRRGRAIVEQTTEHAAEEAVSSLRAPAAKPRV